MIRHISRWLVVIFTLSLVLTAVAPADAQQPNGFITNAARVNLRTGPGANYPVVTVLSNGQQLFLQGQNADGSWLQVSLFGSTSGWVNARYVAPIGAVGPLPVVAPTGRLNAFVTANFLNVRSGPAANFEVIATLGRNQPVNLLGRNLDSTWVRISVPGIVADGWVSARYIASNAVISSLPVQSNTGITPGLPQPIPDPNTGQTGVVTARNLNVRLGPGVAFASFDIISAGEGVRLVGRNSAGNWLLVQLADGRTGWVNRGFIYTQFPTDILPIRA